MKLDAVTWLDFRADDLSQARDFIRSLQEEGVIDELGFLALQGRFSDLLHPATTTLMRSARYDRQPENSPATGRLTSTYNRG